MNEQFLQKLRNQHSTRLNQVNDLLERYQREGIEPFIANGEKCRADLAKAEADLRAVCALVGIPTDDEPAASSVHKAESGKTSDRKNTPTEEVKEAISGVLSTETKSFTIRELMEKTNYSRAQVVRAADGLVKDGKITEATDTSSKAPGLPPKLFTWKG
jgi:hypothetical protein